MHAVYVSPSGNCKINCCFSLHTTKWGIMFFSPRFSLRVTFVLVLSSIELVIKMIKLFTSLITPEGFSMLNWTLDSFRSNRS